MGRFYLVSFLAFICTSLTACLDETTTVGTNSSPQPQGNSFAGTYLENDYCSDKTWDTNCKNPGIVIDERGNVQQTGPLGLRTALYEIVSINGNLATLRFIRGDILTPIKRITIGQEQGATVLRASAASSGPMTGPNSEVMLSISDIRGGYRTDLTGTSGVDFRRAVVPPNGSVSEPVLPRIETSQQTNSSQIGGPQESCLEYVTTHSNSGHSAYKNTCGFVIHCDPTGPNNITTLQPSSSDNIGLFLQAGQRAQCFRGPADPAGRDFGK